MHVLLHSGPHPPCNILDGTARQMERAFSRAVITNDGKIIWLAGQTTIEDLNGKSLMGDFLGRAKADFALMDRTLKRDRVEIECPLESPFVWQASLPFH